MRIIQFFVITILCLWVINCAQEQSKPALQKAQPFTLYDTDSVAYSLKDYPGKLVMIHFWADWCSHCRGEFPKLQRVYEELQSEGFEILAVNSGQSKDHVQEIKETYALTYPLLVDEEAKTAEEYKVSGLPASYFIDGNGMITEVVVGWIKENQIKKIVKKLKAER
jgi:peroxiredoxin